MAIYHLHAKIISRKAGRSSTAAAAYRAGVLIEDERTGEVHDYTRKRGIVHAEVVMPSGCSWQPTREELWNAVEQKNGRADAQVAREFEIALPHELPADERQALALGFASEIANRYGIGVDVAIHEPHKRKRRKKDQDDVEDTHSPGTPRNFHAHILTTTNRVDTTKKHNLGNKVRKLDQVAKDRDKDARDAPGEIDWLRERWSVFANTALERAGHDARIDHRTLEAQGIARIPQIHLGPSATAMERRSEQSGKQSDRSDRGDVNRAIAAANADAGMRALLQARIDARRAAEEAAEAEQAWLALKADRDELMAAKQREIGAFVEQQALEDEARQRLEQAQIWGATPGGLPPDDALSGAGLYERYGVTMWLAPGAVTVQPDQQTKTPKQIAAALYLQCRDHALHEGWAAIEFFGVSAAARAEIERMAEADGWSDRIQFREDDPPDLDEAISRKPSGPGSSSAGPGM